MDIFVFRICITAVFDNIMLYIFPVKSLIAVPIATFFPGKYCNVSYGDLCFCILEVCHVSFRVYHM